MSGQSAQGHAQSNIGARYQHHVAAAQKFDGTDEEKAELSKALHTLHYTHIPRHSVTEVLSPEGAVVRKAVIGFDQFEASLSPKVRRFLRYELRVI